MPQRIIAAFDIGKKNFAFAVEKILTSEIEDLHNCEKETIVGHRKKKFNVVNPSHKFSRGELLLLKNLDLTSNCDDKAYLDPKTYHNMTRVLDEYTEYWDMCDTIIIEQQMSFGRNKTNTMALKLGQHCYSYFLVKYGETKLISEFPAYHKTQILRAPKKFGKIEKRFKNGKTTMIKDNLKKWSVRKATEVLKLRNDTKFLDTLGAMKKKDDASDCILMIQAKVLLDLHSDKNF